MKTRLIIKDDNFVYLNYFYGSFIKNKLIIQTATERYEYILNHIRIGNPTRISLENYAWIINVYIVDSTETFIGVHSYGSRGLPPDIHFRTKSESVKFIKFLETNMK